MSWSFSWRGKAQDYDPSLVQIGGQIDQRAHGQAMARAAFDAIAEWPPEQHLSVSAYGHATNNDGGQATLNVAAYTPSPVDGQLNTQQPVSVLPSSVPTQAGANDAIVPATEPVGDSGPPSRTADAQAAPSETPVDSSQPVGLSETEG